MKPSKLKINAVLIRDPISLCQLLVSEDLTIKKKLKFN